MIARLYASIGNGKNWLPAAARAVISRSAASITSNASRHRPRAAADRSDASPSDDGEGGAPPLADGGGAPWPGGA